MATFLSIKNGNQTISKLTLCSKIILLVLPTLLCMHQTQAVDTPPSSKVCSKNIEKETSALLEQLISSTKTKSDIPNKIAQIQSVLSEDSCKDTKNNFDPEFKTQLNKVKLTVSELSSLALSSSSSEFGENTSFDIKSPSSLFLIARRLNDEVGALSFQSQPDQNTLTLNSINHDLSSANFLNLITLVLIAGYILSKLPFIEKYIPSASQNKINNLTTKIEESDQKLFTYLEQILQEFRQKTSTAMPDQSNSIADTNNSTVPQVVDLIKKEIQIANQKSTDAVENLLDHIKQSQELGDSLGKELNELKTQLETVVGAINNLQHYQESITSAYELSEQISLLMHELKGIGIPAEPIICDENVTEPHRKQGNFQNSSHDEAIKVTEPPIINDSISDPFSSLREHSNYLWMLQEYNADRLKNSKDAFSVSETSTSMANRSKTGVVQFDFKPSQAGLFRIIELTDGNYCLAPSSQDISNNQYLENIGKIFTCHNYYPDYTKVILIHPAIIEKASEDGSEVYRLVGKGELHFE